MEVFLPSIILILLEYDSGFLALPDYSFWVYADYSSWVHADHSFWMYADHSFWVHTSQFFRMHVSHSSRVMPVAVPGCNPSWVHVYSSFRASSFLLDLAFRHSPIISGDPFEIFRFHQYMAKKEYVRAEGGYMQYLSSNSQSNSIANGWSWLTR